MGENESEGIMSLSLYAQQRLKAAAKKAKREAKRARIDAKRHIETSDGRTVVIPPRWTLKTLKNKLRTELHAAIRARDGAVCISSGKANLAPAEWNAGHLFAVGPYPGVQFHPLNIHSQSVYDNKYLRGNPAAYSAAFIRRYGLATFEALAQEAQKRRAWRAADLLDLLETLRAGGIEAYSVRYFELSR